ncbi:MAG: ATP-binding protein, partial [Candidatus Binatia bacterium]
CRAPGGEVVVDVLRRHAPLWLAQMPSAVAAEERESLESRVAGVTRERMLREMADAIEELGTRSPIVLWLEDLHGSDTATLDLLAFLARRRDPARLLVIGTYRPQSVRTGDHPLYAIQQELQVRGWCHELALEPLSKDGVASYLSTRLPLAATDGTTLRDAADLIHRRTEGNPLFIVSTVAAVLGRGPDAAGLLGVAEDVCRSVPPNVSEFLEQQIERLGDEDRRLLEVASVAGMELSAASAAAGLDGDLEEVERRAAELARRGQYLRTMESEEWPDGTVAARFRFLHALHHEVLYGRVTPARRAALHRRIGERLARGWEARAEEVASELAMHFERGREPERAVEFLRLAGANAMRRYAPREAESFLSTGIRLVRSLPETAERHRRELALLVALGPALAMSRGYADPAVEETYTRARFICRQLGETPEIFSVVQGLWIFSVVRADFEGARELGGELLRLAQAIGDPALLLEAHRALGMTAHFLGDWAAAQEHADQGLALYHPGRSMTVHPADDPGVLCLVTAAAALWARGYPEQGLARSEDAIALARELSHPLSLGIALIQFLYLSEESHRDDPVLAGRLAEAIELFTSQELPMMLAVALVYDGAARARSGSAPLAAIEQMTRAMAAFEATGAKWLRPYFQASLARTYATAGRFDEGLATIDAALSEEAPGDGGFYRPELRRLKGALALARLGESAPPEPARAEIEACFHEAIAIARRQGARTLELRAMIDLARLWRANGRAKEARRALTDLYAGFTEGFETDDMREARALLAELSGSAPEKRAGASRRALARRRAPARQR